MNGLLKHRGRLRAWKWAAWLSLCLLLLGSWVVFDFLFQPFGERTVTVQIPQLCGARYERAELLEWMDVKAEYRYDSDVESGVILAQSPRAGSFRKLSAQNPKCAISVVVSLGEQTVEMPDVMGMDFREAEADLRERGLTVAVERVESTYPTGTVFSAEPRVGTRLPVGSKVTLSVSAGMPQISVRVPDLRGMSRSDALVQLWLSQLAVGEVIEESSDAPDGAVIRQSHQAGSLVLAGTKVNLYISRAWEE